MTPPTTDQSESDATAIDRRRLLQATAGAGLATYAAGCLDDPEAEEPADDEPADDEPDEEFDIDEDETLRVAIERANFDDYDPASSTLADDSMFHNMVYDGLITTTIEGEPFNWMAEQYEVTESQDVDDVDYEPYMEEAEAPDDGELPVPDFDDPFETVLAYHGDDTPAEEGDTVRYLTRAGAADAVDDGVFGVRLEGTLREGITFHNGEELTAENVVRSYDRFVGTPNEGQVFDAFMHAEAPDGDDGYEFELYGIFPDADAVFELPPLNIFPSEHLDIPGGEDGEDGLDPRDGGQVPIGTGPYQIVEDSVQEGFGLVLEKYDDYWVEDLGLDDLEWWDGPADFPASPEVEAVAMELVPEEGTRVAALQNEEVDMIYEVSAADRNNFDEQDGTDVVGQPATGFLYQQFPLNVDEDTDNVWGDQRVREAYQLMVPRQAIVDIVEDGWAAPARLPFPEAASGQVSVDKTYGELEEEDWAYPVEPQPDEAEALLNEAGVETPVDIEIHTNADDAVRQDKMELIVDEVNASGLFDAELVTPADIGDWTTQTLYVDGSRNDYAEDSAIATIGLAAGTLTHPYIEALHDPDNHNGCCNFFHPEGTFDWIEDFREARFSLDAVESLEFRQERYEEIYEQVATDIGNTFVDFSLETVIVSADLDGYIGWNDRRQFTNQALWNPLSEDFTTLER